VPLRRYAPELGSLDTIKSQLLQGETEVVGAQHVLEEGFMKLGVTVEGVVLGTSDTDQLDAHLDQVMEELLRLGAADPSINATLATGAVEVSIAVDAPTFEKAAETGLATLRTAVHAAGGATPDWPTELPPQRWGIALEETSVRRTELTPQ
jgi:hypothetical protein